MNLSRRNLLSYAVALLAAFALPDAARAQAPREIRVDFATYNPVSLVLKERGILERALATENVSVRWVQSLGSKRRWSSSTRARWISAPRPGPRP